MRSVAIRVSVCISVCLFNYPLTHNKNRRSKFNTIFCTCYMWPWLRPILAVMQCVIYFCFVDDVIFLHNGANGSESKTTRIFHPASQLMAAPAGRQTTLFGRICQKAALGVKSCPSDCVLFFCTGSFDSVVTHPSLQNFHPLIIIVNMADQLSSIKLSGQFLPYWHLRKEEIWNAFQYQLQISQMSRNYALHHYFSIPKFRVT